MVIDANGDTIKYVCINFTVFEYLYEMLYINNIIITFLFYNTKISDNIAESGKVPRMLAAFPR
jgi:hypothetical protein